MNVLFDEGLLPIEQSEFLYEKPSSIGDVYLEKIEGLLIGTAIGDALGVKFEAKAPQEKILRYGDIRAYHHQAHISDDTQLTFWTLEVFLNHGWFNPKALANRYIKERIIGIGHTVRAFIKNYKDLKVPWYLAGVKSAGNGALMKLSPLIIPHLIGQSEELWGDAVVTTYLIYNDRFAISSAVAFTNLLWNLVRMNHTPEPEWWLEEYVKVVREIEGDKSVYSPRSGEYTSYKGPAWNFVEMVLMRALTEGWNLLQLNEAVGSGAYLLETVPMVLYTLMMYAGEPFEALVASVTNTEDSDTIGSIVGYTIGALYGVRVFPKHLLDPILNGKLLPSKFLKSILRTEEYLIEHIPRIRRGMLC